MTEEEQMWAIIVMILSVTPLIVMGFWMAGH